MEADRALGRRMESHLRREGIEVTAVSDPADGRDALKAVRFDLIVLSLGEGDQAGEDLLHCLRGYGSAAHVIVIGAARSEADRVRALYAGADDYLTRPFPLRELAARAVAVGRRLGTARQARIRYGPLDIDLAAREVSVGEAKVALTAKEFDLLAFLAARPGMVFSREELLQSVWRSATAWQQARTVTEHVRRTRVKLGEAAGSTIVSVRGVGYRFDPPGEVHNASTPAAGRLVHVDGTIVDADTGTHLLLGLAPGADLTGRHLLEVVPPAIRPELERRLDALAEGSAPDLEQRASVLSARWDEEGQSRAVEATSAPIDWNGQPGRLVEIRVRSGPRSRILELATGILSDLPDAAAVADTDGRVVRWNTAAERMFGWSELEVAGSPLVDVLPWAAGPLAAVIGDGEGGGGEPAAWYSEVTQLARDGSPLVIAATAKAVRDDEGHVIGATILARAVPPGPTAAPRRRPQLDRSALQQAFDRGELEVHYEPIFRIDDGRLAGVEALIRWDHPDFGLIRPAELVPPRSGANGTDLSSYLLREACRQVSAWRADGFDLALAVDVSCGFLGDPSRVDELAAVVAATGLDPSSLWVEIAESELVEDLDRAAMSCLSQIADMGVNVAVNRFGTGWASLAFLRTLPVSVLGVDRSLVVGVDRDPRAAATTRAIVTVGHEIGLAVCGQGVRTSAQISVLRSFGCTWAQGPVFGPAGPAGSVPLDAARRPAAVELTSRPRGQHHDDTAASALSDGR